MNTPNPAAVKKLNDARKAREAELASALANAKDKMPPTKGASKSSDPSVSSLKDKGSRVRTSDSTNDRKPFSTQRNDKKKSDSVVNSHAGSDRTSKSTSLKSQKISSPSSTRSKKEITSSRSDGAASASGSTTQRKQSSTKPNANTKKNTVEAKKPFVRPDHLTTKPLRDNEALQNLRKELEKPARGQFKREYRVGGRRFGKSTQGQNSQKENS